LDAEFARLGRPAVPGKSAQLLADAVEAISRQFGVDPDRALQSYVPDDWPAMAAARIVAQIREHEEAIRETPAVTLSTAQALPVVSSLAIAADWTLRYASSTLLEARHALPATNAAHWLADAVQAADGGPVGFGGTNLAQARLALMAAIHKMRQFRCDCTDHPQVPGQPCRTAALLADRLLVSLHTIGGVMPAPDQLQERVEEP
jgi:hypothetical protein